MGEMIYGYARVSSKGQQMYGNGLEVQKEELTKAGAMKIYAEAYTGTKASRPELNKLISIIKEGDTVIVAKLDRIARTTKDGIDIIDKITNKGCKLHILNMGMFDNTPTGRLMKNIMLSFAEFERDMIMTRMNEGKEIAKANNSEYKEGRHEVTVDMERAEEMLNQGKSVSAMCKELGISRGTWYNKVKAKASAV